MAGSWLRKATACASVGVAVLVAPSGVAVAEGESAAGVSGVESFFDCDEYTCMELSYDGYAIRAGFMSSAVPGNRRHFHFTGPNGFDYNTPDAQFPNLVYTAWVGTNRGSGQYCAEGWIFIAYNNAYSSLGKACVDF